GQLLATFPMQAAQETAFLGGELYRRDGQWKFRAIGQGYVSGLAGLASDFGIDVGESSDPAASQAPVEAPTPPPQPPVTTPPPAPAPPPAPPTASTSLDPGGAPGS